jgi:membrane protease YdiL (CAAX protease family)
MRAILGFIGYLLASVAAAYIAGSIYTKLHPTASAAATLESLAFNALGLVTAAVLCIPLILTARLYIDRRSVLSMGFTWQGFSRQAITGLLLGMVVLGIGSLILVGTGNIRWATASFDAASFFSAMALFALIALEEELVFRGYILNNLMESMDKWTALTITTVVFALVHLGNLHIDAIAVLNLLAGGFLLGINYVYTRNLWFSIFFHFAWNWCQGSLLGYEVSGLGFQSLLRMEKSGPSLLTGGPFGFEGSIIATLLLIVAILFCQQRGWWPWKTNVRI